LNTALVLASFFFFSSNLHSRLVSVAGINVLYSLLPLLHAWVPHILFPLRGQTLLNELA
jgi:hypothetical protein